MGPLDSFSLRFYQARTDAARVLLQLDAHPSGSGGTPLPEPDLEDAVLLAGLDAVGIDRRRDRQSQREAAVGPLRAQERFPADGRLRETVAAHVDDAPFDLDRDVARRDAREIGAHDVRVAVFPGVDRRTPRAGRIRGRVGRRASEDVLEERVDTLAQVAEIADRIPVDRHTVQFTTTSAVWSTISSPARDAVTRDPGLTEPSRSLSASGSWICRWMTRLSGRAPNAGS